MRGAYDDVVATGRCWMAFYKGCGCSVFHVLVQTVLMSGFGLTMSSWTWRISRSALLQQPQTGGGGTERFFAETVARVEACEAQETPGRQSWVQVPRYCSKKQAPLYCCSKKGASTWASSAPSAGVQTNCARRATTDAGV